MGGKAKVTTGNKGSRKRLALSSHNAVPNGKRRKPDNPPAKAKGVELMAKPEETRKIDGKKEQSGKDPKDKDVIKEVEEEEASKNGSVETKEISKEKDTDSEADGENKKKEIEPSVKEGDSAGGDSQKDDGAAALKLEKPNPPNPPLSKPSRAKGSVQFVSTPSFDHCDMVGNTSEDFQINVVKALECIRQEQQRQADLSDHIKAMLLTILETKAQRKPIPCNAVDEFLSPPEELKVADSEGTIGLQTKIEQLLTKIFPQKSYSRFYLQSSKGEIFPQDICVAIYNLVSLTDPSVTITMVRSKLSKVFDKSRSKD